MIFSFKSFMVAAGLSLVFGGISVGAHAQEVEHADLQEGFPTQLDDATPIAHRTRELQHSFRFERTRDHRDLFILDPRLNFGFAHNWHVILSVPVVVGNVERTGSGTFRLETQYSFQDETPRLPEMAVSFRADFPTGVDTAGVDTTLKFHLSRTLDESEARPEFHLNLGWKHNAGRREEESADGHFLALGYSHRSGERTLLIADFVSERELFENRTTNVIEFGVRRKLSSRALLSVGIGAGIDNDSPPFRATVGVQYGF